MGALLGACMIVTFARAVLTRNDSVAYRRPRERASERPLRVHGFVPVERKNRRYHERREQQCCNGHGEA